MAKILRKTLIPFGNAGPTSFFGQFGSKTAGTPQTTKDPTVIQQLAAWVNGWQNAVVTANKAAYLEDMNGFCFVMSYMLSYLMQQGIPEWDSGTTYYLNSVVQANDGEWFNSLADNNLGNTPPVSASNAFWEWVNAPPPVIPPQVPIGSVLDHAGGAIPAGFLLCDGSAVSRVTYSSLFTQIGVTWGIGDGVNTFNLPPMSRRVSVGSGGTSTPTLGNAVGNLGGAETHTLIIAEIPAHTHTGGFGSNGAPSGAAAPIANGNTGATGGGGAHNNMQPSAVFNKIIKY